MCDLNEMADSLKESKHSLASRQALVNMCDLDLALETVIARINELSNTELNKLGFFVWVEEQDRYIGEEGE